MCLRDCHLTLSRGATSNYSVIAGGLEIILGNTRVLVQNEASVRYGFVVLITALCGSVIHYAEYDVMWYCSSLC